MWKSNSILGKTRSVCRIHRYGTDGVFPDVLLGGHGGINGGANMFPELYVDLYHAAVARDMETVSRLQPLVMQISSSIYTVGQHGSSYLKGLKCALSLLGVCDDFVAAPFHRFNVPEREKIRKALEALPFCPELKP